jgi:hypothetical protein
LPEEKRARPTGARRPGGAVAPPAQRRRKQMATALSASSNKRTAAPLVDPPRATRDRILGYGAAAGALLALIGLNISSLLLVIGLAYVAAALLPSAARRDRRLRMAAWVFAIIGVLSTVAFLTLLRVEPHDGTSDEVSLFAYLPLGRATVILGAAGVAALALAAVLAALAFGKQSSQRYRRFSWSALCLIFYFVSTLPATVAQSPAPPALGSFWTAPLTYLYPVLGIVATAAAACAFLWASVAEQATDRSVPAGLRYAQREYLFLVGAVSLFLPRLTGLALFDWSTLQRTAAETQDQAVMKVASSASWLLLLIVLAAAAAAGFWISCRQAGWKPSDWLAGQAAPAGAAPNLAQQQRVPLAWVKRLFLSWRLPVLYGWLLVLVAACSFLGWYGFLAAVPAAGHYLWMLARGRLETRTAA